MRFTDLKPKLDRRLGTGQHRALRVVFSFVLQHSQLLVHLNDMLATLQNQPVSFSCGCALAQLVGFLQIALRFDWLPDCLILLVKLHNQNVVFR